MAITYRESGVDIEEGNRLVDRIKSFAGQASSPLVLSGIGGFAGLCGLPSGLAEPILVSGTDGVGTKLKVAFAMNRHDTIGQDLVAMCVNDIITTGAQPLFFLDYFATGHLNADVGEQVVRGIADGCKLAGCALLGGETAELPGMYADGEYDLAGFAVGVVDKKKILGPDRVQVGDVLIAVASSGIHSNGYSLARRVLETEAGLALDSYHKDLGCTVGEALLRPTKIYASTVAQLYARLDAGLHALCHITGGGIVENLPRVLPQNVSAKLDQARPWPTIFQLIAALGPVELFEMRRTFNLGVGLIAAVARTSVDAALSALREAGEDAYVIGHIAQAEGAPHVVYVNDPEGHRA
jgi:phosphoribosylformylglycinamidine cyclo-ligase